MRGQEKVFDKEEIKVILDNLAIAIVLIASLLMAFYIIQYQGRQAELQNTGMLASTLSGAITALASAPDKGAYCVMMPGTLGYYIVLGKVDLSLTPTPAPTGTVATPTLTATPAGTSTPTPTSIGERSFISAYSPEKGTTGISYLPLSGFTPVSVYVPAGKPSVIAFRKAGTITMEAVEGTVERANCDTVMAATPAATPTSTPIGGTPTPTPTASGIIISGEGGDITI